MAPEESTSLVQRCTDFVSEHKKAVIIGTAAVAIAAGGAAYYASSSRPPGAGDNNGERKSRDKKRSGKSSKKRKTVNDKDGPIIEERSPKVVEEQGKQKSCFFLHALDITCVRPEDIKLSQEQIDLLPIEVLGTASVWSDVCSDICCRSELPWLLHSKPKETAHINSASSLKQPISTHKPSISHQKPSLFSTATVQRVRIGFVYSDVYLRLLHQVM